MFQAARTEFSSNSLTSTLTTVTEVSLLNGTVVRCIGEATESLTIIVAGETYSLIISIYNDSQSYRATYFSICSNGNFTTKPTQFLYYHSGLGLPLLYWWCVCQVCPHHLSNTSLWVTSHRGDHLSTDHCFLQHSLHM